MDSLEGGKEENLTVQRGAARAGVLKDYSGHWVRRRREQITWSGGRSRRYRAKFWCETSETV